MKIDENNFINNSLTEILEDRYSKYAKYIIQERALPDARDGLKPVQRRILYSMYDLKLNYKSQYKKSARIVGEVIGKYHPHGDTSVYEAMVRMSQEWKIYTPLISFQGNNGSVDGDSAAAMRYTEVKLSKISEWLLKDLNKEIIQFIPNFDDAEIEPTVLPAPLPNLLINGASGIAAGYATNIPPHNITEIINALIYRINNFNCDINQILKIVKGPDFPTGGIVENKDGIESAFKFGRGMIVLKSKIEIKDNIILITEIPYEINKKTLIQSIDDIRLENTNNINIKKVQDYSDKDGISIYIEVENPMESEYIKNYLLKKTNLQITYNYNMIAIIDKKPVQCNILDLMDCYLKHRENIIIKKTKFELKQNDIRLNIIRGLIKCASIMDHVIKTIRKSKNKQDAIQNLIKHYSLNFEQAEAIVLLRLYKLTTTDINEVLNELKELTVKQSILYKMYSNKSNRNEYIIDELNSIKNEFSIERKTIIKDKIEEIIYDERDIQAEREVFLTISKKGYIRFNYLNNKINTNLMKIKYGDYIISRIITSNKNTLFLITNKGNYFSIDINNLEVNKNNEFGTHVSKYVKININETIINSIIFNDIKNSTNYLAVFTKNGIAKKIKIDMLNYKMNKIFPLIKLNDNDNLINVFIIKKTSLAVFGITKNGYNVKYDLDILKDFKKIKNKGTGFIKLKNKDELLYADQILDLNQECLLISNKNKYKIINFNEIHNLKNPGIGTKIKNLDKNIKISFSFLVNEKTQLYSFKDDKTIETTTFQKIYLSKRFKTFQKVPTANVTNWILEKHDTDINEINNIDSNEQIN